MSPQTLINFERLQFLEVGDPKPTPAPTPATCPHGTPWGTMCQICRIRYSGPR